MSIIEVTCYEIQPKEFYANPNSLRWITGKCWSDMYRKSHVSVYSDTYLIDRSENNTFPCGHPCALIRKRIRK